MDFWRTVLVLFRRWYITVPAFFATLVLAGAAYSAVPVQYESGSVLVLTTPLAGGTQATDAQNPTALTNPLLTFDRSLALTASIVIQQMNSSETALALGVVPGGTTSYQVTNGSTNPELLESGPFLFVQGTGPTPEAAQDIADEGLRHGGRRSSPSARTSSTPGSPPTSASRSSSRRPRASRCGQPMRAAAAVGALAGLASLAAVFGFESLMTHRRRRRAALEQAATRVDTVPTARPTAPDDGVAMTLLGTGRRVRRSPPTHPVPGSRRSADATTILGIFVALQFVLPSRLVMNYLPLSLSAASLVALGLGALWFCTQMTTTLGAAKGRSPVRTLLFVYSCVLLASYAARRSGTSRPTSAQIGDHAMVTVFALIFVVPGRVRRRPQSRAPLLPRPGDRGVRRRVNAVVGILQFLFAFDLTPHLRPPGMHFYALGPLGPGPRRPATGRGHDRPPDRVRRVLRDDAAAGHARRVPRLAGARRPGLVDLRGADRRRADVLGVALGDPRGGQRRAGPARRLAGPAAAVDGGGGSGSSW